MYVVIFQTLCALVRAVYRKRLGDHGFDVINILIGFDAAEAQMQVFFYHFLDIIRDGYKILFRATPLACRAASSERTIAILVWMFFGSFVFCARVWYDQGI